MFFEGGALESNHGLAAVVTFSPRGQVSEWPEARNKKLEGVLTSLLIANPDGFLYPG